MRARPARWRAPAKLTRSLRVVGRRADGYHLLEAEMVSLDWGDDLLIGPGSGLEVVDQTPWPGGAVPAGPDNLVSRAVGLVGREAAIRLTKRVPAGAGLGGGSSDAAAVLRWAGVAADQSGFDRAARLGADVPFCLLGGRARVSGVGERVDALEPLELEVSLLLVPLACSTPAVYAEWDRIQLDGPVASDPAEGAGSVNDLEAAALRVEPGLAPWRDAWAEATGLTPRLAGSGSTWFVEQARPDLAGSFPNPTGSGPPGYVVVTRTDRP
ncbi:MAG: 4-(cytidine 5'-diphospho)-2-C-methyl-D-erythritol kinase [Acidimicrobiales bacterium]